MSRLRLRCGHSARPTSSRTGIVEGLPVAVGGADQEDDVVPLAQLEAVHLAVGMSARRKKHLGRRVVAQQLFDGPTG